jgi:hypothetical protein
LGGTKRISGYLRVMENEEPGDRQGNEPSPLLLLGVSLLPLFGLLGWYLGLFG